MRWEKEFRRNKKSIKQKKFVTHYFKKTEKLLDIKNDDSISILQFIAFSDEEIMITGINEAVALIKYILPKKILSQIEVYAIKEKEIITKNTPIMKIIGNYKLFCNLENIIIGVLTSRSNISTNVLRCIRELKPNQEIIYMLDRANSYFNQSYDGYAAYCAGIKKFVTEEQVKFIDNKKDVEVVGTIPHSIIQQYKNDINSLIVDYYNVFKSKICLLLDFENNVIKTLELAKKNLYLVFAVRIDTSKNLIDFSLNQNDLNNLGVNPYIVNIVREWLDKNGFPDIKIIVSSNINPAKILEINNSSNVDMFGIGSFFLDKYINISADLVKINNVPLSKYGRKELFSKKLIKYI